MDYDPPETVRGTFADAYPSQLSLPIAQLGEFRRQEIELTSYDVEFVRAAYDEEVLFVDQQIGALRRGLSSRDLIDDTLVLLTSDHGEELFDHGGFEHGHAMWQELVRVPLVVWGPGVRPGRETAPVSLVDVMPTVLDWLTVEPPAPMDGVSLRSNLVDEAAIAERALFAESVLYGPPHTAVIRWPYKMIVDAEDTPVSLVDLQADPSENHNVLAARPDVVAAMAADLYAQRKAAARARAAAPDEQASPGEEIIERLRSLGYVR